jgi:hypothetical protein
MIPVPEMFIVPVLLTVIGLAHNHVPAESEKLPDMSILAPEMVSVPPDWVKLAPAWMVTDFALMVPLVITGIRPPEGVVGMITSSAAPGTPEADQLPAVFQSVLTAPVHVFVAANRLTEKNKKNNEKKIKEVACRGRINDVLLHPGILCTGKQLLSAVCLHRFFIRTNGFFLGWIIKNPQQK